MLNWLTAILLCQLLGEAFVTVLSLPIPGPVVGMAILFLGLMIFGSVPEGLAKTGDALLSHLSLMFVPAGVGVMLHFRLLGENWLPLGAALLVSTLATIAITAAAMTWLNRRTGDDG